MDNSDYIKELIGYSDTPPRCSTCQHVKLSLGYTDMAVRCSEHCISVSVTGCCNDWEPVSMSDDAGE